MVIKRAYDTQRLVAGALGASLENRQTIRNATYGYRQRAHYQKPEKPNASSLTTRVRPETWLSGLKKDR